MGFLYRLRCSACGLESDELPLGAGMLGHVLAPGWCPKCRRFVAVEVAKKFGEVPVRGPYKCYSCGGVVDLLETPVKEAHNDVWPRERLLTCPLCGQHLAEDFVGCWD